jgi:uncharacterized membrane protein YcaP (DUF421 family)
MSFDELIGKGPELTILQMSIRAALVFIIVLVLLRFAGRRAFGMNASFDNVISILLGAVISRAVIGASPFWATIIASLVIVVLYRIIAWLCLKSDTIGKIVKSDADLLYHDGKMDRRRMNKNFITEKDLMERVRQEGNVDSLSKVDKAFLERDGCISIIKKEDNSKTA